MAGPPPVRVVACLSGRLGERRRSALKLDTAAVDRWSGLPSSRSHGVPGGAESAADGGGGVATGPESPGEANDGVVSEDSGCSEVGGAALWLAEPSAGVGG